MGEVKLGQVELVFVNGSSMTVEIARTKNNQEAFESVCRWLGNEGFYVGRNGQEFVFAHSLARIVRLLEKSA